MLPRWRSLLRNIRRSVRYKVLLLVLLPLLLIVPLILGATIFWGYRLTYEQLFIKVNTDLSVADDVFRRLQQDYLNQLARFGESYALRTALEHGDYASIQQQLVQLQSTQSLAYLQLLDKGQMAPLPDASNARQSAALQIALRGQARVGLEIFTPADLRQIDPRLEETVRLPLVSTPYAYPTTRQQEERGMMLRALYPLRDAEGNVLAVLDGGVLLNGNFTLVDTIRDLVYGTGRLPAGSIGTVTLFLDDVRISTNVPLKAGERALGTRVSAEVRDTVLGQGKAWIDRAFVVNDWYISGYEPLTDSEGQRVGILYAGYSEAPFRNSLWQAVSLLWLLFTLLTGLTAWLAIKATGVILHPLEKMREVIRAISADEPQRIGKLASHDEIAELASRFDAMLELLQQRNAEISEWANQLERKVDERTAELQQKNTDLSHTITLLQTTRDQLVAAEKMAALGELTAGMAHEINNPVAVILGNLDVMIHLLGEQAQPVQPEIDLMLEQIERIRAIIHNLLQYARPIEPDELLRTDLNPLIAQTLKLVGYLHKARRVVFHTELQATRRVRVNPPELQQVLVNLIRNAMQALAAEGGEISISTADVSDAEVVINVRDNGCGIAAEHLTRIFDPFFTTKPVGQGTGLGLSISYAIVHRYGGRLTVESHVGVGACFSIYLPG
ncbi:sensor histidine kinase [Thiothrix subterranea]|uniref:histidine kinase n=1 Tax=Thiothrix subterranea TaxID=2735563 RepID=A0AA51R1G6_9GAMM|nr:cache domain-containing protein [Thiothrix subterranea]MDQ5770707.1 cache domain-containing protein [Thiothrix subterranea]WML89002.1 cache domain-containing protein [Thiothrix subterranea]